MKSTVFRSLLTTALCSAGLVSYGVAASHAGHGHANQRNSGPGFSRDENPGFFGRMGKDEHNDFFTRGNNPGVQGSAFGQATAAQAGATAATKESHSSFNETLTSACRIQDPVTFVTPMSGN